MIKYEDDKFFNEEWKMEPYGENGILFLAEYLAIKGFPLEWKRRVVKAIEEYKDVRGIWRVKGEQHLSHDNFTAIVCLSSNYNLPYHKNIYRQDLVHCMLHPRDFIFYNIVSGVSLAWVFYPFALLAMMYSCYSDFKVRNGVRMLKTDGKLLTWLRCKSFDLPLTARICSWVLSKRTLFSSWKRCFEIYFLNPKHPLRNQEDEKYLLGDKK